MDEKQNGHSHVQPIEKIIITFDPNHGSLNYSFENCDYQKVIGHLALTQLLVYDDLKHARRDVNIELSKEG